MANAAALIFPCQEAEAFGLVTIESQAYGTPVIISDIGANAELVQHSKTGFVCKKDDEYLSAIRDITVIDRGACRNYAEKFSIENMVDRYDALYQKLIST